VSTYHQSVNKKEKNYLLTLDAIEAT